MSKIKCRYYVYVSTDLAPLFVDLGQSENLSEIMQPLSPVGSHFPEFVSDSF